MIRETGQVTCYAVQMWASMTSRTKDSDWHNMALWSVLGKEENPRTQYSRNVHTPKMQKLLRKYEESLTDNYMKWGHRATCDEKLASQMLIAARKDKPNAKWRLVQMDIAVFVKEIA